MHDVLRYAAKGMQLGPGDMVDLAHAGGWLMVPLVLASVVALAICIERAWVLRRARIVPPDLLAEVAGAVGADDTAQAKSLCTASALGRILLAGFDSASRGRDSMREAMEDAAGAVVHDLERYLTALGTIAAISPLLGLLGTVIGMIRVFAALMRDQAAEVAVLAGGISEALVTTAAGLTIAIPALMFHRYLLRKVDDLTVEMEHQATRFADLLHPEPRS